MQGNHCSVSGGNSRRQEGDHAGRRDLREPGSGTTGGSGAAPEVSALELARLQFGITTLFHFIFVPLSIGLAAFVAVLETARHRTGKRLRAHDPLLGPAHADQLRRRGGDRDRPGVPVRDELERYSRFVGDVFGAPLAMEALAAFFLESTFIGLWIFGRDRLPPRVHLATIWLVAFGTALSAYFILAANSWMQHPVGYRIGGHGASRDDRHLGGPDELDGALRLRPHDPRRLTTGGVVILAVSAWHLLRRQRPRRLPALAAARPWRTCAWPRSARLTVGHFQAQLMTEQQPMKMAAAEALYSSQARAPFSLFAVGALEATPERLTPQHRGPEGPLACWPPTPRRTVEGIDDLQAAYEAKYGPGDYRPMIGGHLLVVPPDGRGRDADRSCSAPSGCCCSGGARLTRPRRCPAPRGLGDPAALPGERMGWVFTEMGRQPWVVQGLLQHRPGRLAHRQRVDRGAHLAGGLHAPLRRPRRRRRVARAPGAARRARSADRARRAGRRRRRRAARSPTRRSGPHRARRRSGSCSSPSSGPATSSWRASTSASACSCPCSVAGGGPPRR